ncbi:MAG: hypothetical protein JW762_12665, partial [Dehalococcoidales bacterium]|nr:hypothetical protein [Dehalococcoidales bacterium]
NRRCANSGVRSMGIHFQKGRDAPLSVPGRPMEPHTPGREIGFAYLKILSPQKTSGCLLMHLNN